MDSSSTRNSICSAHCRPNWDLVVTAMSMVMVELVEVDLMMVAMEEGSEVGVLEEVLMVVLEEM